MEVGGGGGGEDGDDGGWVWRDREEDRAAAADADAEAVQVYCAVGKDAGKEWRANLRWVLANLAARSRSRSRSQSQRLVLVLAHVHRPPRLINIMGAWVPVSQLADHEVAAYRKLEEERASRGLDDLIHICTSQRVHARKVVVAGEDAARGLVQLVEDHGVAELVMGAAADRAYTRKMRAPRSKKAVTVQRKASPGCRIWFVCKGNLVCTRESSEVGPSTSTSPSLRSSAAPSDRSRSKSSSLLLLLHGDADAGDGESLFGSTRDTTSSMPSLGARTPSRDDGSDNATDHSADDFSGHEGATMSLQDVGEQDPPTPSPSPSRHGSDDASEMDGALHDKLRDAIAEAGNLRREAYEETRRRQKADRDLADASRMARDAESSWQAEARRRREAEERLARERAAMEQDRRELDAILEKIREVDARSVEIELQIAGSERAMGDLGVRMSESCSMLDALRLERRREEPAVQEDSMAEVDHGARGLGFLRLELSELDEATCHFDESARIGGAGGGRGGVYRGNLHGMSVAVKIISPDIAVDEAPFARAVDAMARARHPGLVTLVGACPEARAVVHELVSGGSLEARLVGEGDPMPWHARCGVAYRTCAALAYLHSTATVHGDVRPSNILLEDERGSSSKLAGLGMRTLAAPTHASRMALAYVDPRWLATGEEEPTPRCDVHALGVVLLRLVTCMPAFAARKAAKEAAAVDGRAWHDVVDVSAGGWPMERATEIALLGLRCCDDGGTRRLGPGEMLEEARCVLEASTSAAPGRTWSSLSSSSTASEGSGGAPSYFLCPILKEVMRDPMIAGDGFTYEAEAMREWLGSGHDTSPMTNLKLPTDELVPNHALRAAIQEWRHTRPSSFGRLQ